MDTMTSTSAPPETAKPPLEDSTSATRDEQAQSEANLERKKPRQLSRLNLFLLIRILFHYLEKVDRKLLVQAKEVLKDCEKRQKDEDHEFPTLAEAIQTRMREIVGETHWNKALVIQKQFLINQQKSKKLAVVRQISKQGKLRC